MFEMKTFSHWNIKKWSVSRKYVFLCWKNRIHLQTNDSFNQFSAHSVFLSLMNFHTLLLAGNWWEEESESLNPSTFSSDSDRCDQDEAYRRTTEAESLTRLLVNETKLSSEWNNKTRKSTFAFSRQLKSEILKSLQIIFTVRHHTGFVGNEVFNM